jgi:uncharacterized cupredoxin-like copper-binding protein
MRAVYVVGAVLLASLASGSAPTPAASDRVTVAFRYSRFEPAAVTVPAGVPVTFTLRNDDPIEHEWIVGPPEVHAAHRVGTEPVHDSRPTEVTVPAYSSRVTTITFDSPGEYAFVCHLPGHEAYGMSGILRVR